MVLWQVSSLGYDGDQLDGKITCRSIITKTVKVRRNLRTEAIRRQLLFVGYQLHVSTRGSFNRTDVELLDDSNLRQAIYEGISFFPTASL